MTERVITEEMRGLIDLTCVNCTLRTDGGLQAEALVDFGKADEFREQMADGCDGKVGGTRDTQDYCPVIAAVAFHDLVRTV